MDVTRDVDLVEEVARHYGYDRLPTTFPPLLTAPAPPDARLEQDRALRRLATAAGFNECVTFSFISETAAARIRRAPASASPSPIRSRRRSRCCGRRCCPASSMPSRHNRRHGQRDVRLFELGTRFLRASGERRTLASAWSGAGDAEHWSGRARAVDFFDLKGVVEHAGARRWG